MEEKEQRIYLIQRLIDEKPEYRGIKIPQGKQEQKDMLRSLMNVRTPGPIDDEFLVVQDAYLKEAAKQKGIVKLSELKPISEGIYLWQGDITRLCCDAIVNAANSGMTGCYYPCHKCIDNCIHTYAGIQLRLFCADMMKEQGHEEETGKAKITPAFNLPCKYILHTVGPIVWGKLTTKEERELSDCYRSCLLLAEQNNVKSIAFSCISTGEFHFPNERAAEIAIQTVTDHMEKSKNRPEVIFNVFKDADYEIYQRLLGRNRKIER